MLASLLPRRYWQRSTLPAERFATLSAVLTAAAGVLVGVDGFMRSAATPLAPLGGMAHGTESLTVLEFLRGTRLGWVSAYLSLSGVVRVGMAIAGRAGGEPVIAGLDALSRRVLRRRAEERRSLLRRRLEGPEVPDVLVTGASAGIDMAEWVVIASRLKAGWERGVFVVTTGSWYRLGRRQDRQTPEGLRAFYPLHAVAKAEVLRRSVYYDHPRLSALGAANPPEQGPRDDNSPLG